MITQEDIDRLREINEEMFDLLEESQNLIRRSGCKFEYERARAYWIGHIDSALGGRNFLPDRATMKETIDSIEATLPSDDGSEDEEEDSEENEQDQ